MVAIGDSFVRQTGVPLISLDTQCDLTTNQTVVTLKQSPFPNQNQYPGTQWTVPLTLAYGDALSSRKTVAMKDLQTQVRLNGCSAVLADPSGLDYYVTNYSNNAWSQLLAQSNALKDPVLLTSLPARCKRQPSGPHSSPDAGHCAFLFPAASLNPAGIKSARL
jgi:aminopeptidase N